MILRYILYFLIAVIIIYMLLGLLKPRSIKTSGKSDIDNSIKSYDRINYLGGIPGAEIADIKDGTLHIYKDTIVFDDSSSELFTIPIKGISKCSLETKETLYASRDGLQGVLTIGLVNNKYYIKIKYINSSSSSNIVILHSYFNDDYSKSIVEEVNKRMK
ncbi:MAG: hypothetical protein AB7V16_08915 [Vulcanibacillus sp.]